MKQVAVTFEDYYGKRLTFRFGITDSMAASPYTELLAWLQDLVDASAAKIVEAVIHNSISLAGLTGNTVDNTQAFHKVTDQAILQFRVGSTLMKTTLPAPVDGIFLGTDPYPDQIDEADALTTALIATGVTAGLLRNQSDVVVSSFDKGWRKGQPHA